MAANKSDDNKKPPKSEMIRVPSALIPAVRQLSKLHREGHAIALLQELEEVISKFDSNIDIDVAAGSKSVQHLEERLSKLERATSPNLETKLEAIAKKLELIERAIAQNTDAFRRIASGRLGNNIKPRKQAYPYQQPQVELQPRNNENLAQRLGVNPQSLIVERENKSAKEFTSWSRNRDPMTVGWEWNALDGLYHPIR